MATASTAQGRGARPRLRAPHAQEGAFSQVWRAGSCVARRAAHAPVTRGPHERDPRRLGLPDRGLGSRTRRFNRRDRGRARALRASGRHRVTRARRRLRRGGGRALGAAIARRIAARIVRAISGDDSRASHLQVGAYLTRQRRAQHAQRHQQQDEPPCDHELATGAPVGQSLNDIGSPARGFIRYSDFSRSARMRTPQPVGPFTKQPLSLSLACTPAMSRWHHDTPSFTK